MAEISENQTVREEIITEQGEEIEKLRKRVQYWSGEWEQEHKFVLSCIHTMVTVANQLAVSTCVDMTHRQRNTLARNIVALLMEEVKLQRNIPSDDIPF